MAGNILDDVNLDQALFFLQDLNEFQEIRMTWWCVTLKSPVSSLYAVVYAEKFAVCSVKLSKVELESLVDDVEHFLDTYQCRCLQSIQVDHQHIHYQRFKYNLRTLQNLGSHHLGVEMQLHLAFSNLWQILGANCIAVAGQISEFSSTC